MACTWPVRLINQYTAKDWAYWKFMLSAERWTVDGFELPKTRPFYSWDVPKDHKEFIFDTNPQRASWYAKEQSKHLSITIACYDRHGALVVHKHCTLSISEQKGYFYSDWLYMANNKKLELSFSEKLNYNNIITLQSDGTLHVDTQQL